MLAKEAKADAAVQATKERSANRVTEGAFALGELSKLKKRSGWQPERLLTAMNKFAAT